MVVRIKEGNTTTKADVPSSSVLNLQLIISNQSHTLCRVDAVCLWSHHKIAPAVECTRYSIATSRWGVATATTCTLLLEWHICVVSARSYNIEVEVVKIEVYIVSTRLGNHNVCAICIDLHIVVRVECCHATTIADIPS